jgi:hypothetical protein
MIEIYEARTAKLLATLTVRLRDTTCPETLTFVNGRAPTLLSRSDSTEDKEALAEYVK